MITRSVKFSYRRWAELLLWSLLAFGTLSFFASLQLHSGEENGLSPQEREQLSKAKDPQQRLKICLDIASHRMKEVIQYASKADKDNTPIAVKAYQTACTEAEKCVVETSADSNLNRKMVETLFKTMQSYNTTLLRARDKTPDEFRPQVDAAFNVSTGVQQSMTLRGDKFGIK
ncbi:MAG: hypothetical protein U0V70_06150 [Terriglobia bacterium]